MWSTAKRVSEREKKIFVAPSDNDDEENVEERKRCRKQIYRAVRPIRSIRKCSVNLRKVNIFT